MSAPDAPPVGIFVYGTLKRGGMYHRAYCPEVVDVKPAMARGWLYGLPAGYPAMVEGAAAPSAARGEGLVHGEVLTFPDLAAAVARIDPLETYDPEGGEANEYVRVVRRVRRLDDGGEVPAYLYLYAPHRVSMLRCGARLLPAGRWPA